MREQAADAVYAARDGFTRGVRYIVAGDVNGRIRRGVLYAVAVASLYLNAPLPGLIAVVFLTWTDAVVLE